VTGRLWPLPLKWVGILAALLGVVAIGAVLAFAGSARAYVLIFGRLLLGAFGLWLIGSVLVALAVGKVRPMTRAIARRYRRQTQAKQFWWSMAWNAALGCGLVTLSVTHFGLSAGALQAKCYNEDRRYSDHQSLGACSLLIDHWTLRGSVPTQDAYLARGNSWRRLGNMDHALEDYTSAIRFDPTNVPAYESRGMTYVQKGDSAHAIADFTSAVRLSPDDPDVLFLRGYAYQTVVHDPRRAIADYTAALRLKPDDVGPMAQRAFSYRAIGDYPHAIADFSTLISKRPNDPSLYLARSRAYAAAGNSEWAEDDRATAIRLDPQLAKGGPAVKPPE
jgi:tetratricopeptide (TPR) repeat protein